MASAYLRYTCNGVRLGSQGNDNSVVARNFAELLNSVKTLGLVRDLYVMSAPTGSLIKIEYVHRSKAGHCKVRETLQFIIGLPFEWWNEYPVARNILLHIKEIGHE